MQDSIGLQYLSQLKIGLDELQWLQRQNEVDVVNLRRARMFRYGFIVGRNPGGDLASNWRVHDEDADGTLTINVGSSWHPDGLSEIAGLITRDGYACFMFEDADILEVPNDNTWYTLVVRRVVNHYEPGTLTLAAASPVVLGVGTEFTRFSGVTTDGYGRGTNIRIDAADSPGGNAGTYEIDLVVSDTEIHMTTAMPGANEVGIPYTVAGDFFGVVPLDPDIHLNASLEFSLIAVTREAPSSEYLILADVRRNGAGVDDILDRRHQNVWRSQQDTMGHLTGGVTIQPLAEADTAAPYTALSAIRTLIVAGTFSTTSLARRDGANGLLAVVENVAGGSVDAWAHDSTGWYLGPIVVAGVGTAPALLAIPVQVQAPTYDHICVYETANRLFIAYTDSDGAAWVAGGLIWDPTAAGHTVDNPTLLLLDNNRILCAATFLNAATGATEIRVIYSDDLGATWQTNAQLGWVAKQYEPGGVPDNVSNPALTQAEDRSIWLAHEFTITAGGVRSVSVTRCTDPLGITWPVELTETHGSSGAPGDEQRDPQIWACPTGEVVVIYTDWENLNFLDVRARVLAVNQKQEIGNEEFITTRIDRRIFRVFAGAVASTSAFVGLGERRGGALDLVWADLASDLRHTPILAIRSPERANILRQT